MRRSKRPLIFLAISLLILVGGGLAYFSLIWIPENGRELLESKLKESLPVDLKIETVAFSPIGGLTIGRTEVIDRLTGDLISEIDEIRTHINWIPLMAGTQIPFIAEVDVQSPLESRWYLKGAYDLQQNHLKTQITSRTPLDITELETSFLKLLPEALQQGIFDIDGKIQLVPRQEFTFQGRLVGSEMRIDSDGYRLDADARFAGRITQPLSLKKQPPVIDGQLEINHGEFSGPEPVKSIRQIEATLDIDPQRTTIERFFAEAFNSQWKVDGHLDDYRSPKFEITVGSRTDVATIFALFEEQVMDWTASGPADVHATCRGRQEIDDETIAWWLDCTSRLSLDGVSLNGPPLAMPLQDISGDLIFDHFNDTLSFENLKARLPQSPITVNGTYRLQPEPTLDLSVTGTLALPLVVPAVSDLQGLTVANGLASINLNAKGPQSSPHFSGSADLEAVELHWDTLPHPVKDLSGLISFDGERLTAVNLQAQYDQETYRGRIEADLSNTQSPRISGIINNTQGSLKADIQPKDADWVIHQASLEIPQGQLDLGGTIEKQAPYAAQLQIRGKTTVAGIRSFPLPINDPSHLPESGTLQIDANYFGPIQRYAEAMWDAQVFADQVVWKKVPMDQLHLEAHYNGEAMQVKLLEGLIAGGPAQGRFFISEFSDRARCWLNGDIADAQLPLLKAALVPDTKHALEGIGSAQFQIEGPCSDLPSWQGKGWAYAAGEDLGRARLLDRLLGRGLISIITDGLLGLSSLRQMQIREASLHWVLDQQRFHTEDMRLAGNSAGQPVAFFIAGSVGLDKTLDLVLDVDMTTQPETEQTADTSSGIVKAIFQVAQQLHDAGAARVHIGGTMDEPKYTPMPVSMPTNILEGFLRPTPARRQQTFEGQGRAPAN